MESPAPERARQRTPAGGTQLLSGLRLCLAAAALCLAGGSAFAQSSPDSALGRGDKVQVTVFGRPDLSGEFRVRRSATLSLPLLGELSVKGMDLHAIEEQIAEKLGSLGLAEQHVAVEVVEYRPFYILGDVAEPGQYPYVGGLTVQQAIAVAGGVLRIEDMNPRMQIEALRAREDMAVLLADHRAEIARQARLRAERNGLETITFPPELLRDKDDPAVAAVMAGETSLFQARRAALSGSIALHKRHKAETEDEIAALKAQIDSKKKEAALVATELKDIRGLVEKGLAPKSRLLTLQSESVGIEGESLAIRARIAEVRQDANDDELAIFTLKADFARDVADQWQEVQARVAEIEARLDMLARRLPLNGERLSESVRAGPAAAATVEAVITRDAGNGPEDLKAGQHMLVLPGDTIMVRSVTAAPPMRPVLYPDGGSGRREPGAAWTTASGSKLPPPDQPRDGPATE